METPHMRPLRISPLEPSIPMNPHIAEPSLFLSQQAFPATDIADHALRGVGRCFRKREGPSILHMSGRCRLQGFSLPVPQTHDTAAYGL